MRMEARIAKLEQQHPVLSAQVRAWLGWPVSEEELAKPMAHRADPAELRTELRDWLGL